MAARNAARALQRRLHDAGYDGSEASCPEIEVTGVYEGDPASHEDQSHNFSAYLIDVDVDDETGALVLTDALYVADVGTVINPIAHQGQIDGGFVYGLGHALTEELLLEDGRIVNASLADYKIPSQRDCPPFRTVLLPSADGPGPFGAKAVGEISTPGVAPAIANAVFAACGARVRTMPITAERIFTELQS
jgi:CO/xanthine dehydrogenase Mo-binding subunit